MRLALRLNEDLALGFVANHFDVVPVRTNDKSCIVNRVLMRTQTRCTVVFTTRLPEFEVQSPKICTSPIKSSA